MHTNSHKMSTTSLVCNPKRCTNNLRCLHCGWIGEIFRRTCKWSHVAPQNVYTTGIFPHTIQCLSRKCDTSFSVFTDTFVATVQDGMKISSRAAIPVRCITMSIHINKWGHDHPHCWICFGTPENDIAIGYRHNSAAVDTKFVRAFNANPLNGCGSVNIGTRRLKIVKQSPYDGDLVASTNNMAVLSTPSTFATAVNELFAKATGGTYQHGIVSIYIFLQFSNNRPVQLTLATGSTQARDPIHMPCKAPDSTPAC